MSKALLSRSFFTGGAIFLNRCIGNPQLSQIPPFIGSPHLGHLAIIVPPSAHPVPDMLIFSFYKYRLSAWRSIQAAMG